MRFGWILAAAVLAAAGCSSETDGGGGSGGAGGHAGAAGSGGSGGDAGAGGSGGDGGTGGEIVIPTDETDTGWDPEVPAALDGGMNEPERPSSCGTELGWFTAVRGWVTAPGGKLLPGAMAQLCVYYGTDRTYVCLSPSEVGHDGVYTIDVPDDVRCFDEAAMRVIQYDTNRATVYCPIDRDAGPAVRLYDPGVLPFALPAIDLPPTGDRDAPRDVIFDDGLVVVATPSRFQAEERVHSYRDFSARRVPNDAVGLCGDAPSFDGLYAMFPEGQVKASGGFPLRIPNVDGYAAGARVELFVLGGISCYLSEDRKVPEGTWAKFGEGTVSDDGAFIASDENAGLPCFTWLAYRAKE